MNLASFTTETVALSPPSVPLAFLNATSWPRWAHAGGVFQVQNAIVDRHNRIGAWSDPFEFHSGPGWTIFGDARNQTVSYDALALCWKLTCIVSDNHNFLSPGQVKIYKTNKFGWSGTGLPWSRLTPRKEWLSDSGNHLSLQEGGSHTDVSPMPHLTVSALPQTFRQFAWCYTAKGQESGLSPATTIPEFGNSDVMNVQFIITGQPTPAGADGYRVYGRESAKHPWRRCYGTEGANFPLDNYMPLIVGAFVTDALTVDPVPVPVVLDAINVALRDCDGDITVPDGEVISLTQPIIDIYSPAKFGRVIGTKAGGRWTTLPTADFGQSPVLIVQNQRSHWRGLEINAESGNAKCGLAFADFSGGQAFGNKFSDLRVSMNQTGSTGMCQGVRVLEECAGGGHSASELIFERCGFGATNPIWLEHKQTCNLLFRDCSATAFVAGEHLKYSDCVVWISMGNRVVFDGLFHADAPGGVIFNLEGGRVSVDSLFIDKGCVSLFDNSGYAECELKIDHATVNWFKYPSIKHSDSNANLLRSHSEAVTSLTIQGAKFGVDKVQSTANGYVNLIAPVKNAGGTATIVGS